jgi:arylsulfatase A-like enzyme
VDVFQAGWVRVRGARVNRGHRGCGLGSADSGGAGTGRESADVPYAEPAFTGHLGKTLAESAPAYPERPAPAAGAPNILLIMLDDIGFGQAGVSGGPVDTPFMDGVRDDSAVLTRFHTTSLCSPTRAALLTGRNHHRVGFGTIVEGSTGFPGYNCALPNTAATIAATLTMNGYSTAWFGKNHNTPDWESSAAGPFDRWPTGMGFEYFYGFNGGETSQFEPQLYENITPVEAPPDPGYHLTEDLVDRARTWIGVHQSVAPAKPFFLYFATGALHAPHHVPESYRDRYKGQFDRGWDQVRAETLARQKQLGLVPENTELTSRPDGIEAWEDLDGTQRQVYARMQEIFAAYVKHTDDQIGRLLSVLDELDLAASTLVVLIVGDNGPSPEGGPTGTINDTAAMNGVPDTLENILPHLDELGSRLHDNHYPIGWAHAGSAPFQWMKQVASHFGGTRNLAMLRWPGHVQPGPRAQFHHIIDVVPTLLDAAQVTAPAHVNGVEQMSIDGISMDYLFTSADAADRRTTQYFEHGGNRAIYHDGWIASARHGVPWQLSGSKGDFDADTWELYDLAADFSQARDLAAEQPSKLAELKELFEQEAWANNVYPLDDRFAERAIDPLRPSLIRGRASFRYLPGATRIPEGAAPPTKNVSHRITARITVPDGGASGVVVAQGGRTGGFSLFFDHGVPVYHYNFFGKARYEVRGPQPLPAGDVTVAVEFLADADYKPATGGIIRLAVANQTVAEGRAEHTVPGRFSPTETFDIGCDLGAPVCDAYTAPATFTGAIADVEVTITAPAP